jgi:hypothetical protein
MRSAFVVTPNNRMQRAVTHKVLGRGRGRAAVEQVIRARVPTSRRAGADAGRYAPFRARPDCGNIASSRR